MKTIPFDFVLEALAARQPYTRPMFGCTSVYVDTQIVLILREKENPIADDGVWLATTPEHHESLQREFPSMRSITIFGPGRTGWQVLPVEAPDFEESVLRACDLILARDPRIGKTPKPKKLRAGSAKKKKKSTAKKAPIKKAAKKSAASKRKKTAKRKKA